MSTKRKLKNKCQYCGQCCAAGEAISQAIVTDEEIKTIAKRTGMKPEEFVGIRYYNIIEYKIIERKHNGACIFLKENENSLACEIYDILPEFCARYPSDSAEQAWCTENRIDISKRLD